MPLVYRWDRKAWQKDDHGGLSIRPFILFYMFLDSKMCATPLKIVYSYKYHLHIRTYVYTWACCSGALVPLLPVFSAN